MKSYDKITRPEDIVTLKTLDNRAWFAPVRFAIEGLADLTYQYPLEAIQTDGVTPAEGDRVLVYNASDVEGVPTPRKDGIYIFHSVPGDDPENPGYELTPAEADEAYFPGKIVPILEGIRDGNGIAYVNQVIDESGTIYKVIDTTYKAPGIGKRIEPTYEEPRVVVPHPFGWGVMVQVVDRSSSATATGKTVVTDVTRFDGEIAIEVDPELMYGPGGKMSLYVMIQPVGDPINAPVIM